MQFVSPTFQGFFIDRCVHDLNPSKFSLHLPELRCLWAWKPPLTSPAQKPARQAAQRAAGLLRVLCMLQSPAPQLLQSRQRTAARACQPARRRARETACAPARAPARPAASDAESALKLEFYGGWRCLLWLISQIPISCFVGPASRHARPFSAPQPERARRRPPVTDMSAAGGGHCYIHMLRLCSMLPCTPPTRHAHSCSEPAATPYYRSTVLERVAEQGQGQELHAGTGPQSTQHNNSPQRSASISSHSAVFRVATVGGRRAEAEGSRVVPPRFWLARRAAHAAESSKACQGYSSAAPSAESGYLLRSSIWSGRPATAERLLLY